ncbi:MAG TPA: choice-of-anchor D domain-containing protein, partial [Kofleriaceae bacterium]|nr:choice-of-anchor D domain-containing protein [Kofleriaceae bacterium]
MFRRLVATIAVLTAGIGAFAYADRTPGAMPVCSTTTTMFAPGSGSGGSNCIIDIVESSLTLAPPTVSATAHVVQDGTTVTMLQTATITGANPTAFAFTTAGCTANTCDFSAAPHGLPTTLDITCTPTSTMQFAELDVTGTQMDGDAAQLMCAPNTSTGPVLSLSTHAIAAPDTPVNTTSDGQPALVIANAGSGTLSVGLSPLGSWSIPGNTCVSSMCVITSGNPVTVIPKFHPGAFGPENTLMAVTSNDPMHLSDSITMSGKGTGSILVATPTDIDFGSVPKNQPVTRTVTIADTGNIDLPVALGTPAAPFAVSAPTVTATPSMPATFNVTCQSATALGPTDGSVPLTSMAYQANTPAITVHCQVVDTEVQVMPTSFDFGEVRVHTATQTMTVVITNAGTSPANVTAVQLSATPAGLSLSPGSTSTTLSAGASTTANLSLQPDTEVDLAGTD